MRSYEAPTGPERLLGLLQGGLRALLVWSWGLCLRGPSLAQKTYEKIIKKQ